MDKLWLLTEAMESLLEDIEAYRNDLASKLISGQYESTERIKAHIKDLYRRLGKFYKPLGKMRRDCLEALAMMRKYPSE